MSKDRKSKNKIIWNTLLHQTLRIETLKSRLNTLANQNQQYQDILKNKNEELYLQNNLIQNQENYLKFKINRDVSLKFIQFLESIYTQQELVDNQHFVYLMENELEYKFIKDVETPFSAEIHEPLNESESDVLDQVVKFGYSYLGKVIRVAKVLLKSKDEA